MRECVFEASSASGARVQGRPTTGFLDDRLFLQASSSHCCVLCLADPRAHMAMLLKTPRSSATHPTRHTQRQLLLGFKAPRIPEVLEIEKIKKHLRGILFFIQQNPTSRARFSLFNKTQPAHGGGRGGQGERASAEARLEH